MKYLLQSQADVGLDAGLFLPLSVKHFAESGVGAGFISPSQFIDGETLHPQISFSCVFTYAEIGTVHPKPQSLSRLLVGRYFMTRPETLCYAKAPHMNIINAMY